MVPLELRMQRYIYQALKPARASRLYLRDTFNRFLLEPVIPHQAEPADALRYQHRPVRQECNGPRLLEMLREDDDSQLHPASAICATRQSVRRE